MADKEEIKTLLESGRIDHSESDRNSQFELNRNSQCTNAPWLINHQQLFSRITDFY